MCRWNIKRSIRLSAQTNQVQFISHQDQAAVNLPQVDQQYLDASNNANVSSNAFKIRTPASVQNFVTNTISADAKKRRNQVASRSGVAGTGYTPGDILRVVGGTPVVRLPAVSIEKLTVNNPGVGYNDPKN